MPAAKPAVAVLGGGGQGKMVVSTLLAAGRKVKGVYDDDRSLWGRSVLGARVRGPLSEFLSAPNGPALLALGDNRLRKKIDQENSKIEWTTAVHPKAVIDPTARLAPGCVVFAGAVIQPDAWIGRHAIINTGATVDHDCRIGDFSHLAPGTHLCGQVVVEEGALMGVGSVAIPLMRVGAWSTVGAGAVVLGAVAPGQRVAGNPAKPLPVAKHLEGGVVV